MDEMPGSHTPPAHRKARSQLSPNFIIFHQSVCLWFHPNFIPTLKTVSILTISYFTDKMLSTLLILKIQWDFMVFKKLRFWTKYHEPNEYRWYHVFPCILRCGSSTSDESTWKESNYFLDIIKIYKQLVITVLVVSTDSN